MKTIKESGDDNLDFVKHDGHMELIVAKIVEKLEGNEVVVFE